MGVLPAPEALAIMLHREDRGLGMYHRIVNLVGLFSFADVSFPSELQEEY